MKDSSLEASTILSLVNRKYQRQFVLLGYSLKRAVPFLTQLFCLVGHSANICQVCAPCKTLESTPVNQTGGISIYDFLKILFLLLPRLQILPNTLLSYFLLNSFFFMEHMLQELFQGSVWEMNFLNSYYDLLSHIHK